MKMREKLKGSTIRKAEEAGEISQQKKQQQQQSEEKHDDPQENQQQKQNQSKREKKHKIIKQQETRRLQDASRAERDITALQRILNPEGTDESETTKTIDIQSQQNETDDDEDQEVNPHPKKPKGKKQPTKSLAAFSATMASLLAQEGEGGSAVLSQDARVFDDIKTEQTEERIRREIIAERRHKRSLTHRVPSEDDPELEANLKRLATKGTVTFLNVLMAARRREATESPKKQKTRKRKRFVKRPSDKSKLIASKK